MTTNGSDSRTISNSRLVPRPWSSLVDLTDWLEDDADLIAVIDATSFIHPTDGSQSQSYLNKALRCSDLSGFVFSLIDHDHGITDLSPEEQDFELWLESQHSENKSGPRQTVVFEGHVWSTRILHDRWTLIRGVVLTHHTENGPRKFPRTSQDNSSPVRQKSRNSRPNISNTASSSEISANVNPNMLELTSTAQELPTVRCFMSEPLSAHQTFVRDFDWAATPIGSMSTWKSQLIESVSLVLTATEPAAVFWGRGMISIYNEAFISIAGQKHPTMMGDTPMKAFAEVWDQFFEDRIQLSRVNRKPFSEDGLCLLLERLGYPEETFMTFTFLPLLGYSGEVVGFYHTVTEVTQQILSKRRMSLLLSSSETLSRAQNLRSFWKLLVGSLHGSELDTPFVVLYSVSDQGEMKDNQTGQGELRVSLEKSPSDQCHLEGYIGYPPDHEALLDDFQLHDNESAFAPYFRTSMISRKPNILTTEDGTLPVSLVKGLEKRGYSDECRALAICPLRPTNHDAALGFLVIGLSPRRPCDDDYRSFINLLVKNISSSLASVVLLEDEKKRGLNNAERAAYERAQLTARLQERELENQLQEHKFMLMAHQVPVGIFDLTPFGEIKFCNQAWYDMTKQRPDDTSLMSWIKVIHDEDRALVEKEWATVSIDRQPVSFEGRLKTSWQADPNDKDSARLDSTWFLARMYPVITDDGNIANVIGSITDISFQKYGMAQQIQLVEEAIEAKRQQENFIDMTSHEMRNPLNAMLLCAEELCVNLQNLSADATSTTAVEDAITNSVESAETIIYCGRHQKRIIDDVLTLSKLDASLLQIIPIEAQPVTMVEETLKLFDSEVRAQGIDVGLEFSESLQELNVVNVLLDPSRVVQILVNFIANAIKFTKTEEVRRMLVTVSASRSQPSSLELASSSIQLIPHGGLYQDPTTDESWGKGEPLYLQFIVHDSGPGISSEDMVKLFGRFAQARPKTHAHYEGSGLGLFISQQLAELQGGRVGIASEPGVGSSFYFYVKTRRAVTEYSEPQTEVKEVEKVIKPVIGQPLRKSTSMERNQSQPNATSILIVEDNLVNQKVLRRQLQKLGYNVLVANHGEEALQIIRQSELWRGDSSNGSGAAKESQKLNLILMDIEMPVMDGRECIQRIREHEHQGLLRTHVPVIALTANARPEQISGARNYGFDEVVSKPFQLAEVVRQIGRFLEPESTQIRET